MAETTSDEFYQISKAAELALNKVALFQTTMISNNKTLSSSLNELGENIAKVGKASAAAVSAGIADAGKKKKDDEKKKDEGMEFKPDAVVTGALQGGAAMIKMAMDLQQTQTAFEQLTGSAMTAKALIGSLQTMAVATPFNSSELMKNAEALLVSGAAAENIVPTLNVLGDVSRGNKDKLDELTKTFIQVQADGKLTSSTMGELVKAGFDPLKEIAQTTGISMAKLQEDLMAGKISADQLTNSLISATEPGGQFFGAMQAQSETAGGKWQEFNDRMQMASSSIGNSLMPMATNFINNALLPFAAGLERAATWLSKNSALVEGLTVFIGAALIGYKLWAIAQGVVNLAMSLNPIGLVIAGIAALIGLVIYAWNTFSGFRGTIVGTWEWLKTLGTLIKEIVVESIKSLISAMSGLGKAISLMFKGEWSEAWKVGKSAVNDLVSMEPLERARAKAGSLGKAFSDGYDKGVKMKPIKMPSTPPLPKLKPNGDYTGLGQTPVLAGGGTQVGGNAKDKVEGITGGGARNIIINLQKLFDNINISSTTVKEGVADMEQIVTEALLRVLNSANAIPV
jgi:tape measure domain-containing protein